MLGVWLSYSEDEQDRQNEVSVSRSCGSQTLSG